MDRIEQGWTGQNKDKQDRTRIDTRQDRTRIDRIEQGQTEQNKDGQNRTRMDRIEQ